MNTNKNKTKLYLLCILLLAFILRIYKCNLDVNMYSSDETALVLSAIYYVKLFSFTSLFLWVKSFFHVISQVYGYGYTLVIFVNILILRFFHINLNEFTLSIPYIIYGTINCLLIYLIVKELYNDYAGLIAALLLAISPWHILCSRTAGIHSVWPFLFLCALYFFILACKSKMQIRWQWICASFFVGLHFSSDGQFPLFFLLMIFVSYILSADKSKFYELMFNKKIALFPILFLLPVFAAQVYFFIIDKPSYGYLGHYLARKAKLGFYLPDILAFLKYNLGGLLLGLFILGLICNYKKLFKKEPASIIYAMFFLYIFSWLFVVPKSSTAVTAYLYPAELALTMLAGIFLAEIFTSLKIFTIYKFSSLFKQIVLGNIILVTLLYAGGIYGFKIITNVMKIPTGIFLKNYGAKTAGYIIRQKYAGNAAVNIFTDLEPPTARYYFSNLNMFAAYDINLDNPSMLINFFNKVKKDKINIAALSYPAYQIMKKDFHNIGFNATIIVKNKDEAVFFIMEKEKQNKIFVSTSEFDPKFDRLYGNIKGLLCNRIFETYDEVIAQSDKKLEF